MSASAAGPGCATGDPVFRAEAPPDDGGVVCDRAGVPVSNIAQLRPSDGSDAGGSAETGRDASGQTYRSPTA